MSKQLNKLYRLSNIINLISDKIPQLNSYNVNRILVWDKSLLNLINDNLNLKNKDIAEKNIKGVIIMSDKKEYTFIFQDAEHQSQEKIESRGYKKAVKSFQAKYPKATDVKVIWYKDNVELQKEQKIPMGRKKKLEG